MYDTYVNAVLSEQAMEGNSLMTAYSDLDVYKRQSYMRTKHFLSALLPVMR